MPCGNWSTPSKSVATGSRTWWRQTGHRPSLSSHSVMQASWKRCWQSRVVPSGPTSLKHITHSAASDDSPSPQLGWGAPAAGDEAAAAGAASSTTTTVTAEEEAVVDSFGRGEEMDEAAAEVSFGCSEEEDVTRRSVKFERTCSAGMRDDVAPMIAP